MARRMLALIAIVLLVTPRVWAQAPEDAAPEGINANIFVNYGAAYREGAWAPVDVIVRNDQEDVSGSVEVRLVSPTGNVKSPIYRVSAESPKHSVKRFRLYCKMEDAARIEVQLYHGKRSVMDFPAWIAVTPIRPDDFLCLVLDSRPEDYSFLSTTLYRESRGIRFHREALSEDQLGLLADHLACYASFDLIVLGDINPAQISERHRALLEAYVRRGGLLAVFTGGHAEKYRGSWVEPLLGAGIGAETLFSEKDLAQRAFPGNAALQAGLKAERQGIVSSLTPTDAAVQRVGADPVLATRRPLGSGAVAGFALDCAGMLLQDCVGYHTLWRDLISRRAPAADVNYTNTVMYALPGVPELAGVELFPISSIILYLVLYFLIAIVANWLFWNYFKRREWAWVSLVFFSIGFTAYAMIYGTQGRASRTELEQFDLLRLPQGDSTAEVVSFAGILSEGSNHYAGKILREDALVEDVSLLENRAMLQSRGMMQQGVYYQGGQATPFGGGMGMYPTVGAQPFQFIQDSPPTFSDFYIGASDLRFVRTTTFLPLDGGIDGKIELDNGTPNGELLNNTGLPIVRASLLLNGQLYPITVNGNRLATNSAPMGALSYGPGPFRPGMPVFPQPGVAGGYARINDKSFRFGEAFVSSIFADVQGRTSFLLPPCLIAELAGAPLDVLNLEDPAVRNLSARYLMAEVAVTHLAPGKLVSCALPVQGQGRLLELDVAQLQEQRRLQQNLLVMSPNDTPSLQVSVPPWLLTAGRWNVFLDVYASSDQSLLDNHRIGRQRRNSEPVALPELKVEMKDVTLESLKDATDHDADLAGFKFRKEVFALAEGARAKDLRGGFEVTLKPGEDQQFGLVIYFAAARAVPVEGTTTEGETVLWQ